MAKSKGLRKELEKVKKQMNEMAQKHATEVENLSKLYDKATKAAGEFGSTTENEIKKALKGAENLNDALGQGVSTMKDMDREVRKLHLEGALDSGSAKELNDEFKKIEDELLKIHKLNKDDKATWEDKEKLLKSFNKKIDNTKSKMNLARNTAKSFTDHMEDSGPSFMKGWAKFSKAQKEGKTTFQSYEGMFNKAGTSMSKMPGLMKGFGKAAKGAGAAFGGISKMIAGWPGMVFMAVKALWDVGMQADQFVKDANKAFASVRGPDIMTGDIKKQFEDFNYQIFSASENIRTGMDVTQIRELMEAMTQAGAQIQTLNRGLLSYRDAIYIAAKASKTLGIALPQVGNIIGKLLVDFRMDMESIDKTFVQVAFDAGRAGISTDRFWTTVENASASLALYGNFVGAASKTMKAFTEGMVGGATDAASATEDMFSVFKTGDTKQLATLLQLADKSGEKRGKFFKEQAAKFGDQVTRVQSEIAVIEAKGAEKTPGDVKELKKLRMEMARAQSLRKRALDVSGKNTNAVVQATEAAMIADKAPELLTAVIRQMTGVHDLTQISGKQQEKMIVALKGMGVTGVKETTVRMLIEQAKISANSNSNLLKSSKSFFNDNKMNFQDNQKKISKAVLAASEPGKDQVKNGAILADLLKESLGMDAGMAGQWAEIIKTDKEVGKEIARLIELGDEKSINKIDGLLKSSDFINKYSVGRFSSQEKIEKELAKKTDESFKELVKGTLSYKEMVEIGKDEIKYRVSNLGVLQAMNVGVANIYGWLTKDNLAHMSASEKVAQHQLKVALEGNKEMKALAEYDKKTGNMTIASQQALIKRAAENVKNLNKLISTDEAIESSLKNVAEAGGSTEAITNEVNKALKAGEKEAAVKLADIKVELEGLDKILGGMVGPAPVIQASKVKDPFLVKALEKIERGAFSVSEKKKKIDELRNKFVEKSMRDNKDSLVVNKKELTTQEGMQKSLDEMNRDNALSAKIQKLKLLGDEESMAMIGKEINSEAQGNEVALKGLMKKYDINTAQTKKAFEAAGVSTGTIDKLIAEEKEIQKGQMKTQKVIDHWAEKEDPRQKAYEKYTAEMGDIPVKGEQGLQKPVQVTSPGSVVLHTGERILPTSYSDFKTVPTVNAPVGGGMVGGGTTSKTINVNVSANTRDLGDVIANKVRAVVNQEYIGVV